MEISFYCRMSKVDRKGLAPIEMSIVQDKKRVFVNVGIKCQPQLFAKSIKKGELKAHLATIVSNMDTYAIQLSKRGMLSSQNLKKAFLNGSIEERYTIKQMIDDYMLYCQRHLRINTYETYTSAMKILSEVIDVNEDINSIDSLTVKKYLSYLEDKGYKDSTIFTHYTRFKTVYRYALDNDKVSGKDPFKGIKISRQASDYQPLSEIDYESIKKSRFNEPHLEHARKELVLLGATGLAYSDMKNLTLEDFTFVDNKVVIRKRRIKTNVQYTSVLLGGIETFEECKEVIGHIHCNQHLNVQAKVIAKRLNISTNVSCHKLRHFYITHLVKSRIPLSIVKQCADHSNIGMTERYVNLAFQDVLDAF